VAWEREELDAGLEVRGYLSDRKDELWTRGRK